MLQVLCAGRDPVLLRTRQLMLQQAGFATKVAIGTKAAVEAFTGRRFDVVVLCHTFTERERHFLQLKLHELAPTARLVTLEYPETAPSYSPQGFLRMVTGN